MGITPEQLRKALADMFRDPETRGLIYPYLARPFPIEGAMACPTVEKTGTITANRLTKWAVVNDCTLKDTVAPVYEDDSGKIGIGTSTPVTTLDVCGTIRAVLDPNAPFGTYLMPTGGSANGFRFGFGNNLYFDGANGGPKGMGPTTLDRGC